ncbi:unnamed protein product [Spodoptera littoralis]|uniref:CHK kinase-like domain-containing protein n=1 Tax=Spodoptera littoralis TaxID=7109 RepID=A0A9P0HUN8_SPOLI|nr:unnamed protein product [Spodoptera littoralis]CAH1634837.1 unnamed protein product [Spodoptera littoralis]
MAYLVTERIMVNDWLNFSRALLAFEPPSDHLVLATNHVTMAPFNFEGSFEDVTEKQLEFINKVIEEHGFKGSKVTFAAAGAVGDNYAANVKRIKVEGEKGTLSIIAKIAPINEIARYRLNAALSFGNEHLMYSEYIPKLLQLQKDAGVPEDEQIKFPKCYGTNIEAPNEVILLEDLKVEGFTIMDRMKSLSNECVTRVLKNLAIFHSLSFVLRNKDPESFKYFKDHFEDMWGKLVDLPPEEQASFEQMENVSINMLDDPKHKDMIKNKVSQMPAKTAKMTAYEHESPYSVIQHGDSWTNNILFKFEISSPANDLLYMIFNCTDHETRINNYYNWLDYYHAELGKSLEMYGFKVDNVYPRSQLDGDLKRYAELAFGCNVLISGILTANPEEAGKFKDAFSASDADDISEALTNIHDETAVLLKKRLVGLIDSYIAFDLF